MHDLQHPSLNPDTPAKSSRLEEGTDQLWESVTKSTQLANQNLVQQNSISYQQALSQIAIAGISKCLEMISQVNPGESHGLQCIETYRSMIDQLNHLVQAAAKVATKTFHPSTDSEES